MFCLKQSGFHEETIKKSRFVGLAHPCHSASAVTTALKDHHTRYPGASHLAYAYRLNSSDGILSRYHDAGEPSGTAGKPVLQLIEARQLINVLIVVVRYYGGIKLGTGGLSRAYVQTARSALANSVIEPFIIYKTLELRVDYNALRSVEYYLKKYAGKIEQQRFESSVDLIVSLPELNVDSFQAAIPAKFIR